MSKKESNFLDLVISLKCDRCYFQDICQGGVENE